MLFLHLKRLLSGLSKDSLSNSRIPDRSGISGVYTWFNPLPSTCFWVSSVFFLPFASPLNLPLPLPSPVPLPLLPKATCFPVSLLENRPKVLAILDSEIGLEIASILTGQEPGFMGRDRERARGKTRQVCRRGLGVASDLIPPRNDNLRWMCPVGRFSGLARSVLDRSFRAERARKQIPESALAGFSDTGLSQAPGRRWLKPRFEKDLERPSGGIASQLTPA